MGMETMSQIIFAFPAHSAGPGARFTFHNCLELNVGTGIVIYWAQTYFTCKVITCGDYSIA